MPGLAKGKEGRMCRIILITNNRVQGCSGFKVKDDWKQINNI
jgi:hypothetical protein